MTFNHVSKRQMAAAATALTIAALGIACSVGGGTTVTAARKSRAAATATPAASVDAGAVVDGATEAAATTAGAVSERAGLRARQALRRVGAANGVALARFSPAASASANGSSTFSPGAENDPDETAGDAADIVLRIPQRASVSLPRVSNITLPRVEGASVQVGTLPSAQPGWKTTVDLGDPEPQVTLPKVHVGTVATVTMPGVSID